MQGQNLNENVMFIRPSVEVYNFDPVSIMNNQLVLILLDPGLAPNLDNNLHYNKAIRTQPKSSILLCFNNNPIRGS